MKITDAKFKLNQKVYLGGDIEARITHLIWDGKTMMFSCGWFHNGDHKTKNLRECEISSVKDA